MYIYSYNFFETFHWDGKKSIIECSILNSHITEYRLCLSTTKKIFDKKCLCNVPDVLFRAEGKYAVHFVARFQKSTVVEQHA